VIPDCIRLAQLEAELGHRVRGKRRDLGALRQQPNGYRTGAAEVYNVVTTVAGNGIKREVPYPVPGANSGVPVRWNGGIGLKRRDDGKRVERRVHGCSLDRFVLRHPRRDQCADLLVEVLLEVALVAEHEYGGKQ
jgi:hypothetical protein